MSDFATVMTSSFLLPQVVSVLGVVLFAFALLCESDTRRVGWCGRLRLPALVLVRPVELVAAKDLWQYGPAGTLQGGRLEIWNN
jgi:hypothetical protein